MVTDTRDRRTDPARARDAGAKPLPHERDETPEHGDQAPRGVMQQAADDLEQGLVDTDLHGIRGVEASVPEPAKPGQARPRPNAGNGMRHHTIAHDKDKP
ncbi:MAG: hypothetical protein V4508_21295 [Pseudomonadota bacterium]